MSYNFDAAVSPFIKALPPSGLAKFLDIMAANPNIVPLSVGEPDFDIPQAVKDAEINSICEGKSCYTPTLGLLELREAIAADIHKNYGVKYDPKTEIMVTVGVSEALYTTITTIMHPGDEIILPEPCYVANKACVILAGGKPVSVETYQENGFVPTIEDLEKAVTPKTKAIMLGYPNNPTGAIMSKEQIKAIGDWAVKHDLIVISDELYAHLTYGGKTHTMFTSFPEFRDRTIIFNGFSKAYAMTGWRLGFACGPAPVMQVLTKLHQNCIMCAPTTSQYAAVVALRECDDEIERMRREYDVRRRLLVKRFNDMGLACFEPKGAFYVFPSIQSTGLSSAEFCEKLLYSQKVAVVPGTAFGDSGEGFVRVSYAYSVNHLTEALGRIERFLEELKAHG